MDETMDRMLRTHRNAWALTVLCLLRESPMHPYKMQRLIRESKKDDFLDLKRGSLYHNITRLESAGLIEPVETSRAGRRPERTTYRLTGSGEQELLSWLRELLASPAQGVIPFQATLSFLAHLSPRDAEKLLTSREQSLEKELESKGAGLRQLVARVGRLPVLEAEYTRAIRRAELAWIKSLVDDLRRGVLTWKTKGFTKSHGSRRG
jgi:DNA-binding PadR family transcriptional regulator